MAWFRKAGGAAGHAPDGEALKAAQAAADARGAAWEAALARHDVPDFVRKRLADARDRKTPWLSTTSPAELLIARSHGLAPIATVTGTCWFQYGRSWTEGHAEGWRTALARLKSEAIACGAHAVVDVQMRTAPGGEGLSMDYTLIGTALRLAGAPPSADPVVATVPALEFVRLLEADIVPVGLAIGAYYNWFVDGMNLYSGTSFYGNRPLETLGAFWEAARRQAHIELRQDVARQGNGVLARTQFGQLIRQETAESAPKRYLGRHIVIGTVVDCRRGAAVPHSIELVVDMRDELSPLQRSGSRSRVAGDFSERESAI